MTLPDSILARVRWLAENPGHPDAVIAAYWLADEVTALVGRPEGYVAREVLVDSLRAAADLMREFGREIIRTGPPEEIDKLVAGQPPAWFVLFDWTRMSRADCIALRDFFSDPVARAAVNAFRMRDGRDIRVEVHPAQDPDGATLRAEIEAMNRRHDLEHVGREVERTDPELYRRLMETRARGVAWDYPPGDILARLLERGREMGHYDVRLADATDAEWANLYRDLGLPPATSEPPG